MKHMITFYLAKRKLQNIGQLTYLASSWSERERERERARELPAANVCDGHIMSRKILYVVNIFRPRIDINRSPSYLNATASHSELSEQHTDNTL